MPSACLPAFPADLPASLSAFHLSVCLHLLESGHPYLFPLCVCVSRCLLSACSSWSTCLSACKRVSQPRSSWMWTVPLGLGAAWVPWAVSYPLHCPSVHPSWKLVPWPSISSSWVPLRMTGVSRQALPDNDHRKGSTGMSWQLMGVCGGEHEAPTGAQDPPGLHRWCGAVVCWAWVETWP